MDAEHARHETTIVRSGPAGFGVRCTCGYHSPLFPSRRLAHLDEWEHLRWAVIDPPPVRDDPS